MEQLRRIPIGDIVFDEDPGKRKSKVVRQIAQDYNRLGFIQYPVVQYRTNKLIAGKRRIMAAQKAGASDILVVMRDVTDELAEEMTLVENAARDYNAKQADEDWAKVIAMRARRLKPVPTGGRPLTPEGQAIREVAEEEGVTESAVRKRKARQQKKNSGSGQGAQGDPATTPSRSMKHPDSGGFPDKTENVQEAPQDDQWDELVKEVGSTPRVGVPDPTGAGRVFEAVSAHLTLAINEAYKLADLGEVRKALSMASEALAPLMPFGECHPCKGKGCPRCEQRGWLVEEEFKKWEEEF